MNIIFSIIAAVSKNNVIGKNNSIPWYIPSDLNRFKILTLEKALIMGRSTWSSIGHPLINRENIIITNNNNFKPIGVQVVHTIKDAIKISKIFSKKNNKKEVFIIGGEKIFYQTLHFVEKIYITEILANIDGDKFFPKINLKKWKCIFKKNIKKDKADNYKTRYIIYKRLKYEI